MAGKYSIIQYVPDPIADERINIGVLAFDEHRTLVYFLRDWKRIRHFGGENIDFLKDFAARTVEVAKTGLLFPGDENSDIPKYDRLLKISRNWMNSIQFTEPRGSLKDLDRILEDAVNKFLVESEPEKIISRDRRAAARITISKVKRAVKDLFGQEYLNFVRTKYFISGTRKKHELDVSVANGQAYLAAQGISFEVRPPENILDALAWTISDIKDKNPDFPLAVVVLPPSYEVLQQDRSLEKIYLATVNTYKDLGAEIRSENDLESWVSKTLKGRQDLSGTNIFLTGYN